MSPNELREKFPLAAKSIDHLVQLDPNYGAQRHQWLFVERLHEMQRVAPCSTDHTHRPSCYPDAVIRDVAIAQMARERSAS